MPKARMLAGGLVEPGAGGTGAVVAYVAVSGFPQGSRLFKVTGPANGATIVELPSATTVDLGRFDREAREELEPARLAIEAKGGKAAITRPSPEWVCGKVRTFLREGEAIEIE